MGLFCVYIGLFCRYTGLLCGYIGLFCGYTGLSNALTVCVFLFNVTNNTVLVLLVSLLLILLSFLLYLFRCRRPVRLNVRLMRLFIVEFRVSINNFLECRAKPVVLVVVVQERVVAEELRAENGSLSSRRFLNVSLR